MKCAKIFAAVCLSLLLTGAANAQPKPAPPARTNDLAQLPMKDNGGVGVLDLLDQIDEDRVQDFFTKLERQFDGTNLYELGSLKAVALQVLPVLKEFDETQPYAAWLEAHLDDLDAADEMQRQMKTNRPTTVAPRVLPPPTLKLQRSIWVKVLEKRPWPRLAQTYVPKLKPIFASEKAPPELVWVAGVESSFDRRARSPAGAAGMFQLMPETARTEHLSLWPFDERYQPEKSARAAARYLRDLHNHYGDWALALAAYNAGQRRVDKLLKEHKAHSFEAIARWLPAETQMYVPKVEATIRLREGLALADLKAAPG